MNITNLLQLLYEIFYGVEVSTLRRGRYYRMKVSDIQYLLLPNRGEGVEASDARR